MTERQSARLHHEASARNHYHYHYKNMTMMTHVPDGATSFARDRSIASPSIAAATPGAWTA
jgi:hypothetical protein